MKSPIAASFRLLLRDWRGGELGVLFSALLLAVTVVVAISGFVNRLQFNLERESASFLAADLVVSSAKPVPLEWRAKVDTEGLQRGETITFSSMVISDNDEMFLASVKAVGAAIRSEGRCLSTLARRSRRVVYRLLEVCFLRHDWSSSCELQSGTLSMWVTRR